MRRSPAKMPNYAVGRLALVPAPVIATRLVSITMMIVVDLVWMFVMVKRPNKP